MDVYHASTMIEPLKNGQEMKDTFWCEREIISIVKKKSDIKEEKNKQKPSTCDIATEINEAIFKYLNSVDVEENDEKR